MKNYAEFFEKNDSILDAITSDGFIYGIRQLGGQVIKVNPQFEKLFNPKRQERRARVRFAKSILDIINDPKNDGVESNSPVVVLSSPIKNKKNHKYLVVKLPIIQDDTVLELIMLLDINNNYNELEQSYLSDSTQQKEANLADIINNLQDLSSLHEKEFVVKNSTLNSSIIKLVSLIFKDSLTGLSNRRSFDEAVSREVQRYGRSQHSVALILIDLDGFKIINDELGHVVGDGIIVELSELLIKHTRETDMVFRWGGDEFVIIMEVEQDVLELVINKLRDFVASHSFRCVGDKKITISIGSSMLSKKDTVNSWFEKSDQALYQSKNKGRNEVTLF